MHIENDTVIFSKKEKAKLEAKCGKITHIQVFGEYFTINRQYVMTVKQCKNYLKDKHGYLGSYEISYTKLAEVKIAELTAIYVKVYLKEKKYRQLFYLCEKGLYAKDELFTNFKNDLGALPIDEINLISEFVPSELKEEFLQVLKQLSKNKQLELAINDPHYFSDFLNINEFAFLMNHDDYDYVDHIRKNLKDLSDEMLVYLVRIFGKRTRKFLIKELLRRNLYDEYPLIFVMVKKHRKEKKTKPEVMQIM